MFMQRENTKGTGRHHGTIMGHLSPEVLRTRAGPVPHTAELSWLLDPHLQHERGPVGGSF